jgi:hypothetical protein
VVPGVENAFLASASVDLGDDLAALARRPSLPRPEEDLEAPTQIYVPSQQQAAHQRTGGGEHLDPGPSPSESLGQVWEQDFYDLFARSRRQAQSFTDEELLEELCAALAEVRKAAS